MNVTSAQYRLGRDNSNSEINAEIDGQQMYVPLDPDNRHYAAILEWAEEDGNTIQEAD